jgi:mannuronan synthase
MAFPAQIAFKGRYRTFILRWQDLVHLGLYLGFWLVMFYGLPNTLDDPETRAGFLLIGIFGAWRYSWWMINLARSQYYGQVFYPAIRRRADFLWAKGQRPRHIHFLMTTFHENPWTTRKCLEAIYKEVRDEELSATLWIGTGADQDEKVIQQWLDENPQMPMEVVAVRQNQPGKRVAIGLLLRALSRHRVHANDIVVLLDGDSIIIHGCMQKCLSLMATFPSLQALTTDEDAICVGPAWMQKWLTMRFAQRRMWMQSHSLSRRVLTLTGRFSIFRARTVVEEEFIRLVEADSLAHWFWGNFRFLSGDDKSTWYYVMGHRGDMLYLPDALVYTVERIQGNGLRRAFENVLRWSGNMLRNGARAIALGPKVVPPFIWWCLIDQRLIILTTLLGFFTAISLILFVNPAFIFTYILWIMITRLLMSSALFFYSGRIHMSYPLILYVNQLVLAFVKAYLIFRLPLQRWSNRMDQRADERIGQQKNRIFPLYQNVFYMLLLVLGVLLSAGLIEWPDIQQVVPISRNWLG